MAEKAQTRAAAAMTDDKKRAIETAMQQIERTYGKGAIMRFSCRRGSSSPACMGLMKRFVKCS